MDRDREAELTQMAAQLYYLREAARTAGEPLLVYLIGMAAYEAERLGTEAVEAQPEAERLPA